MIRSLHRAAAVAALLLGPALAAAQQPPAFPETDAAQVRGWLAAGKKVTVVDARSESEYLAGHVPGALGIPAQQTAEEGWRLPADKAIPIVYYCRGAG